jgi:hypothetical protein
MQMTRISQAAHVPVRGQSDGVATVAFHHRLTGWQGPYWVGCSYLLPGSRVDIDADSPPTTLVVLDGEVHACAEGVDAVLLAMDSIAVTGGECCSVRNDSNRVAAVMLVVAVSDD